MWKNIVDHQCKRMPGGCVRLMWMCWSHPPAVIRCTDARRLRVDGQRSVDSVILSLGFKLTTVPETSITTFQGIDELKSLGFTTVAMALEDRLISLLTN